MFTRWKDAGVLLDPANFDEPDWIALKDPSIVHHGGRWHMFNTLRGRQRTHGMTYTCFDTLESMGTPTPVVLPNHDGFWAAPHVFFYEPDETWYLFCQAKRDDWGEGLRAVCCTTKTIEDPASWSPLVNLNVEVPPGERRVSYLDFWVICDDEKAHLFFTCDNGQMYRCETSLKNFPVGWSRPVLALKSDLFEANHIYRLPEGNYLNLVERIREPDGHRVYDAYLADELDGVWRPWSKDGEKLYAETEMIDFPGEPWTDLVSHGELVRLGVNQHMDAKPDAPFVYQGAWQSEFAPGKYGDIKWKLGVITPIA